MRPPTHCSHTGFLALVLTQVLCCRLVLNLRAQGMASTAHTSQGRLPSNGAHPVFAHATRADEATDSAGAVSIPLGRFGRRSLTRGGLRDYDYGVKVHVEVEDDSERGLQSGLSKV